MLMNHSFNLFFSPWRHIAGVLTLALLGCGLPVAVMAGDLTVSENIERLQKLGEFQQDQAITELEKLTSDKLSFQERREILDTLIRLYLRNQNHIKAQQAIEQLNQIFNQHGDQKARALALNYQAKLSEADNNFTESVVLIEQALALALKVNDNLLTNEVEYSAGEIYSSVGNFQVAILHQQHAQSAIDAVNPASWYTDLKRTKTLFLQAYLYYSINDQQTALSYLGKAMEIAGHLNAPILLGQILNSRGTSYAYLKQWNLAKAEYAESLRVAQTAGHDPSVALSLANLADVSLNMGDFPDCLRYARQALQIAQKFDYAYTVALARGNLGICQIHSGDLTAGRELVRQSLDYLTRSNEWSVQEITLDELSAVYAKSGMYKEAWNTLQEKAPVSEKMAQEKRENTAFEMKVIYDSDQRQKDNELKEYQHRIATLESDKNNLKTAIAGLVTALIGLLGVASLRRYRRSQFRRQRQEIADRNLEYQSSRDPLTGLLNRRAFQGVIDARNQFVDRRSLDNSSLYDVVVLLDVDHFKQINDEFGHDLGNEVLIELSKRLQDILRENDMLIRWGGEEFLIYLNAVPAERVQRIIERELAEIGNMVIRHEQHHIKVTVSAGYLLLPLSGKRAILWEKVIELIGAALDRAKSDGCNQACGMQSGEGKAEQMFALLNGNLECDFATAVENGVIALTTIAGPASGERAR